MKKNRQKKKKLKNDTSSDASDEDDTEDINQLKLENRNLKHTVRTQTNQIGDLYHKINNLQEKEDKHQERIKDYNKIDRYLKRMTKNNSEVKTLWFTNLIIVVTLLFFILIF